MSMSKMAFVEGIPYFYANFRGVALRQTRASLSMRVHDQ